MNANVPVSEIMTKTLVVATPNTTLDKVKALFDAYTFHHIPVVENERLKGIISKVDLYRVSHCLDLFHSKNNQEYNDKLFKSILAEEVMASEVTVLSPDDTLKHAAHLFKYNQFHALPVVKGEKLVGIVTTYDLIHHAYAND